MSLFFILWFDCCFFCYMVTIATLNDIPVVTYYFHRRFLKGTLLSLDHSADVWTNFVISFLP